MNVQDIMRKAIPAVEFMYDRTAAVKRHTEYVKPSGATGQRWEGIHPAVPCRLSAPSLSNTNQGVVNKIDYDVKMICSADFLILPGDVITVDGREYTSANEPFVYVSHQEVALTRKGTA
ncbi:hypothetical protein [Sporosarcina trichiuri]|uniref:hypothetical protein n=1 Tax=Sporosarcina trichiuri TaxID=3056445 RepID=UPI0025B34B2B|nr:hypothetical protein [Sporosarcina sp. 0.2-SM1T-5]WJY27472.1 hypothetical protein QWT68_00175 [Sporosarcina sp. 0.2-SM1T-5]